MFSLSLEAKGFCKENGNRQAVFLHFACTVVYPGMGMKLCSSVLTDLAPKLQVFIVSLPMRIAVLVLVLTRDDGT